MSRRLELSDAEVEANSQMADTLDDWCTAWEREHRAQERRIMGIHLRRLAYLKLAPPALVKAKGLAAALPKKARQARR